MDDREKIAYLQELAESHFTDGNLSAAIATWQQVLEVDRGNEAAQRGIVMAQQRQAGSALPAADGPFGPDAGAAAGPFDGDATVMFSAPSPASASPFELTPAPPASPPAAGAGFAFPPQA